MDSAVVLAEALAAGRRPVGLSFRYGQRHSIELEAARRVAAAQGLEDHRVVEIGLGALSGSSLTGLGAVPKDRGSTVIGREVPSTYVPARNTVFLALALGLAETIGAQELWIGVNAIDYSGYPDCRPEFLEAFERLANLATAAGTERGQRFVVKAPLLRLDKAQIVRRAVELGVDLGLTHTCYDPQLVTSRISEAGAQRWLACGRCDACLLRLAGFAKAGIADPVPYVDPGADRRLR
jgi:7-cyano-7-deazaguanine synthase